MERWKGSTRGVRGMKSFSLFIAQLFQDLAGLLGRPPAMANDILPLRRELGHGLAQFRQVEDGVVAEPTFPVGRLGHQAAAVPLTQPHSSPGGGHRYDADESALALARWPALQPLQEKAHLLPVAGPFATEPGRTGARLTTQSLYTQTRVGGPG